MIKITDGRNTGFVDELVWTEIYNRQRSDDADWLGNFNLNFRLSRHDEPNKFYSFTYEMAFCASYVTHEWTEVFEPSDMLKEIL